VPTVPFFLLYALSYIIDPVAKLFGIEQPISPVRLCKLVKSNNIVAETLADMNYTYQYSFEEAMIDWRETLPDEWS